MHLKEIYLSFFNLVIRAAVYEIEPVTYCPK
ncbi:hypothetical protein RUMOBE_03775 [Blautia obeum ATCC 29174]|uniref:Uncharacterized protein n=1 Tax=Blautia obeum ATCC 29174 TaxID=411459 RepID=A5ZXM1_9FIRM|nr:hypothetical protein RUMOBE_03775 [Blautia obeum ATCC 29174]